MLKTTIWCIWCNWIPRAISVMGRIISSWIWGHPFSKFWAFKSTNMQGYTRRTKSVSMLGMNMRRRWWYKIWLFNNQKVNILKFLLTIIAPCLVWPRIAYKWITRCFTSIFLAYKYPVFIKLTCTVSFTYWNPHIIAVRNKSSFDRKDSLSFS